MLTRFSFVPGGISPAQKVGNPLIAKKKKKKQYRKFNGIFLKIKNIVLLLFSQFDIYFIFILICAFDLWVELRF